MVITSHIETASIPIWLNVAGLWRCSDRVWECTAIPCVHQVAACIRVRYEHGWLRKYVHRSFFLLDMHNLYSVPLPHVEVKALVASNAHASPSQRALPKGRPKKVMRLESECFEQRKRRMTCSRCKKEGHNKRSCKEAFDIWNNPGSIVYVLHKKMKFA